MPEKGWWPSTKTLKSSENTPTLAKNYFRQKFIPMKTKNDDHKKYPPAWLTDDAKMMIRRQVKTRTFSLNYT